MTWPAIDPNLAGLAVALAVGLLIGAERERRNRERAERAIAGVRTYAVAAVLGAAAQIVAGPPLVAIAAAAVAAFALVGYLRSRGDSDPGVTSEIALVLTVVIGALAPDRAVVAASAGVALAVLLAARGPLHRLLELLTPGEWRDSLVLVVASAVILPQLPDHPMGPYGALNPHAIWLLVVMVLAIGAFGHAAARLVGPRWGLPLSGLVSGFASSIATIAAMAARSKAAPATLQAAVAGAVLSTVATLLQLVAVIAATDLGVLRTMAPSLALAGAAAILFGAIFTVGSPPQADLQPAAAAPAINLGGALIFALTLAAVLLASAAIRQQFGQAGLIAAAAVSGLADGHAAAISVASLAARGEVARGDAVWPILAGLTTNTAVKMGVALTAGSPAFGRRVVAGLVAVIAAAWLGAVLGKALGIA